MKRRTWIYGGATVLVLGALLAWAFAPRPVEVELAPVALGRFESSIDEDAKTRLAERYVVSAPLAGRLERIVLREGDAVEAGAVVARLRPALPGMLDERTVREVRARAEAAEAGVQAAVTRIERARVALEQAAAEVRRSEQLAQQGFVAATKLETDQLAARAAQKEVDAAQAGREVARHELEQARAALSVASPNAAASRRVFEVRTPAMGRVLKVMQQSEAMVALGTPLLEIGDTTRLEIVAELLTTDALAARPGSRVLIERWGGPTVLEGVVERIEPGAFTKVSALGVEEQRVRVLIRIASPHEQWRALGDGFRVGVRIVAVAQDDAVVVPVSAVFPLPADAPEARPAEGAPRMAVFVVDGGVARIVPVQLGGRNGSLAWIREGVKPGAQVIVYPPAAVRDGVKVKGRKV